MFIPWLNSEAAEGKSVKFYLNQSYYEVRSDMTDMDAAPYLNSANRTLVPLRFLGNALGVADDNITWDNNSKTATLKQGDKTLEFVVESFSYVADGQIKQMDTTPELTGDRVMLPARYVAEAFGYNVYWVQNAKTVMVTTEVLDTSKPMDVLLLEDIVGKSFEKHGTWGPEVEMDPNDPWKTLDTWKIDTYLYEDYLTHEDQLAIDMIYRINETTEEERQYIKRIIGIYLPSMAQEVNDFFDYDVEFATERAKAHDLTSEYRWGDLSSGSKGRDFGERGSEFVNIRNNLNSGTFYISVAIERPNEGGW